MPYEFTAEESFQHIMWILDQLQTRLHASETTFKPLWEAAIMKQLDCLQLMTQQFIPKPVTHEEILEGGK